MTCMSLRQSPSNHRCNCVCLTETEAPSTFIKMSEMSKQIKLSFVWFPNKHAADLEFVTAAQRGCRQRVEWMLVRKRWNDGSHQCSEEKSVALLRWARLENHSAAAVALSWLLMKRLWDTEQTLLTGVMQCRYCSGADSLCGYCSC